MRAAGLAYMNSSPPLMWTRSLLRWPSSLGNSMSASGRRIGRRPRSTCSSPAMPFFAVCRSQRGTETIQRYPASKLSPSIERSGRNRPGEIGHVSESFCAGKNQTRAKIIKKPENDLWLRIRSAHPSNCTRPWTRSNLGPRISSPSCSQNSLGKLRAVTTMWFRGPIRGGRSPATRIFPVSIARSNSYSPLQRRIHASYAPSNL